MGIVAIVGRPNVGKSTLFNRLVGMRQAIVDEVAGVTRDRHYGRCEWCGREFSVIDTGGYAVNTDDVFEAEIRKQVLLAIDEADVILFMVDTLTGITDQCQTIASVLRRSKKKVIVVANKVDNNNQMFSIHAFHALGLGAPFAVSSVSGSGTGDLLDEVLRHLPDTPAVEDTEKAIPRLAIVGRPNVGKSSLTNALLGTERNIVTPVAGTTRDAVSAYYNKFGHEFTIVDTAGLRKKTKVHDDLEFYSVMRSVRAIEYADVCILMLEAEKGVEAQDLSIFNLIIRNKKGCVIAVNKWDLVAKETNTMKEYRAEILRRLAPFTDVPVIFTSVLQKQRLLDVLETAAQVHANRSQHIPTSQLNEAMLAEIADYPPPSVKGKFVKIKYVTQLPSPSPSFAFFCNLPQYVRDDYKRFLENKLRRHFRFTGCPMQIFLRKK
ncbi:MAG: ribosome biogenesis GTPase Der [Prevotellaceae bacterium]|jgi:GTP-binding protein|nr:ribosome biogenesis GTPase Der [Prevotellaceae bacterium]